MGNIKDWCFGVIIDRDNIFGILHPGGKLDGTGNTQGNDQFRFNSSAAEANLQALALSDSAKKRIIAARDRLVALAAELQL